MDPHQFPPFYENLSEFHDKYIKKNLPIKSCNLANGLDKFYFSNLLALDTLSCLIRGAWNWPISCLSITQKPRKGDFGSSNPENFLGEHVSSYELSPSALI